MSPLLVLGALAVAQNAGGYAIVITSSAGELDSSDAGKLWRRAAGERLVAQAGYPRVVRADAISGLPTGSTVALAGICRTKVQAELVRDILRLSIDGAHVLPVSGQPLACPELRSGKPAPTNDPERITTVKADARLSRTHGPGSSGRWAA